MEERKMKTRSKSVSMSPSATREEWLNQINAAFEVIDEQYRDTATLECYVYNDGDTEWDVTYQSPETDEEMDGARKRLMMIEAQEKEQLRKLMEKYPDGR